MKLFKNSISILLSLLLFTFLSLPVIPVFAAESNENSITMNEYELVKQLAGESISSLQEKNFDSAEISDIKNYKNVFNKHISNLNTLSDNALIANGYSKSQINIIRNFHGTDAELRRLGATLTLSASTHNFKFDGNYTTGKLTYSWKWNSIPAFKMKDMIAASWNNWATTNNSSNIKYYNVNTGAYHTQSAATFSTDSNGTSGAGHKFNVSKSDNYYYAKSGSGSFTVRSDTHAKKDFFYYIAYGHSQLSPSINFSVGIGGADASISFSAGTVISGSKNGSALIP